MTDAQGDRNDMCLFNGSQLACTFSRPDEYTTEREGEKNEQHREDRGDAWGGGQDMCGEHDRVAEHMLHFGLAFFT